MQTSSRKLGDKGKETIVTPSDIKTTLNTFSDFDEEADEPDALGRGTSTKKVNVFRDTEFWLHKGKIQFN